MKWPWVSRAAYDALNEHHLSVQATLLHQANSNAADWREERTRYDSLLEKFTALRLAGAVVVPPPVTAGAFAPPRPVDEMKELIDLQCGQDYRKRRMMLAQLAKDRAAGKSDDAIQREILSGVQGEGLPV